MARIALDAMGGDFAPRATVSGALLAIGELDPEDVIQLVGRTAVIERELDTVLGGDLSHLTGNRRRIEIIEAPDIVAMSDKPSAAVRGKSRSSMVVGLKLQPAGKSDAFVSAGNTGAQMAGSTVFLKLHDGLIRPAIATILPTAREPIVLLDSGANVDCSAEEIVQFARLGAVYAEDILGRAQPSVGLLSIGEEPEKGNAVVKEAHPLLRAAGINFHGNVEGRDIPLGASDRGPLDVVVCDGFVGNVVLKFYESAAPTIVTLVGRMLGLDPATLGPAYTRLDYAESGGAPLLGVRGISIISHGKSSPNAIKNAIKVASQAVRSRLTEHIGRRLREPMVGPTEAAGHA
ncbi:MAG TPA: phosphate acyltransferase PlsX [Gemmatimonadaceae bacterium]|nr:phosphate acyltransferase PlsX [Gemmatimonadaceae bacterium]